MGRSDNKEKDEIVMVTAKYIVVEAWSTASFKQGNVRELWTCRLWTDIQCCGFRIPVSRFLSADYGFHFRVLRFLRDGY